VFLDSTQPHNASSFPSLAPTSSSTGMHSLQHFLLPPTVNSIFEEMHGMWIVTCATCISAAWKHCPNFLCDFVSHF
jgi:hypothetical protein